jgi:hypothetical protein
VQQSRQPDAQSAGGLRVQLAHARLADAEHRPDLFHVQLFAVVQLEHAALLDREALDRLGQDADPLGVLERGVGRVGRFRRQVVPLRQLLDRQDRPRVQVHQQRAIVGQRQSHRARDVVLGCRTRGRQLVQRVIEVAPALPHRARHPVASAQAVQDRPADPRLGERPELHTALGVVAKYGVEQSDDAVVDEVLDLDVRR